MGATAVASEFRRLDETLQNLRDTPILNDSDYANLKSHYESIMNRLDRFEKDSKSAIDLGLT